MGARKGQPSATKGRPQWTDADYLRHLMSKLHVTESGCWEFQGFKHKTSGDPRTGGYGHSCYRGKHWPSHRLSFFLHNGHIDPKLDVLHACDNPPCCNPDHLSQGTDAKNIGEAMDRGRPHRGNLMLAKTHCPQGHAYDEAGRVDRSPNGKPRRACRICQLASTRKRAGWPEHLWFIPSQPLGQKPAPLIEWQLASGMQRGDGK